MKLMLQTTGEFMLICPYSRQVIEPGRPHVVSPTEFFQERIARGQLRVVGTELPDEASDKDFAAWWKESPSTAIEGYPTSFEKVAAPGEEFEVETKPKKARKKK